MTDQVPVRRSNARLVIGISIILAGFLFTLDNLRIIEAETYLSYWPVVLIVIGVAQLVDSRQWSQYVWSLVLIIGGAWLLGENLGYVSVSIWKLSPLVLVLFGAGMLRRAFGQPFAAAGAAGKPDAFVRGIAVMGGFDRTSSSPEFRGGDLIAVMGGGKVDLRNATMAGNEAVIDVVAFMGGVELLVPRAWTVVADVFPVFGGVGDKTRPEPGTKENRLIVRGTVFMGGVDIKN